MAYTFKRLAEVEEIQEAPETAKAFVEVDGEVKRAAMKFQNKNPLTFVGDSEVSYDGSKPVTIKIPQPDYKENDPGKSGYIKNRPFYSEETTEWLLEEQTLEFTTTDCSATWGSGCIRGITNISSSFRPKEGDKVLVKFDGVEYECDVIGYAGVSSYYIGCQEPDLIGAEFPFTFYGAFSFSAANVDFTPSGYWTLFTSDIASTQHTVSVKRIVKNIKKISNEYVQQSDWNQNNPDKSGYIKNRPFYTEYIPSTVYFEEQTITCDQKYSADDISTRPSAYAHYKMPDTFTPALGDKLVVCLDGVDYPCEVKVNHLFSENYIGAFNVLSTNADDYPFSFYESWVGGPVEGVDAAGWVFLIEDTSLVHTLSVKKVSEHVVKIPSKYIDVKSITFDLDFTAQDSMVSYEKTIEFNNIDQIKKVIENNMNIIILYKESNILKLHEYVRCKDSLTTTGDGSYIYGLGQNPSASSPACIRISYSKSPYTIDNMNGAYINDSISIEIKSIYATI